MTLEGYRKFIAMWLGVAAMLISARFGPAVSDIFNTVTPYIAIALGTGLYMLINYMQKTTQDTFIPDNWLAGKRTFIGAVLAVVTPLLGSVTPELRDATTQVVTIFLDALVPIVYMITQHLSDKKLAASPIATSTAPVAQPASTPLPQGFPPTSSQTASQPAQPAAPQEEISRVKDRIASVVKLINKDTKWDFLEGIWTDKLNAAKQHLLEVNPNMTQEDMNKLLNQYANGVLSPDDCKNVQSVLGLPQVLHAQNDIQILESMKAAERAGQLGPALSQMYLESAIRDVSMSIVSEAIMRVQNESAGIQAQRRALREFGLDKDTAERAMFSGGQCWYQSGGVWKAFNGYELAGIKTG